MKRSHSFFFGRDLKCVTEELFELLECAERNIDLTVAATSSNRIGTAVHVVADGKLGGGWREHPRAERAAGAAERNNMSCELLRRADAAASGSGAMKFSRQLPSLHAGSCRPNARRDQGCIPPLLSTDVIVHRAQTAKAAESLPAGGLKARSTTYPTSHDGHLAT